VNVAAGSLSTNQTALIKANRITAAGPSTEIEVPPRAKVVDAAGDYLIPGLIDMHVHTLWDPSVPPTFFPLFIANGVTTVRDMGGTLDILRETRSKLADGSLLGPRIVAAGAILDGPEPVHPEVSIAIETPDEARAAVAAVAAAGADFVKVYTLLPADAFEAVMRTARERGLLVVGHVPAAVGPSAAARAGLHTIEHQMDELGGFCTPANPATCEPIFAVFREHGTWQVPTLVMKGQTRPGDLCGDPRLRFLPRATLEYWFKGELAPPDCDPQPRTASLFETKLPEEAWLARQLHEAGVPILAGTDAGVPFNLPGWSLHDELRLLVKAGLTPAEALRAATRDAARALGRGDELGAIEPGYLADLVLLSADPLEDIRNTRKIEAVVLNGQILTRTALDQMLD